MVPRCSVVVPARNCARTLRRAAAALLASDLPRDTWELIVVDDSSTDDSAQVAREVADRVVQLTGGARGPAFARNRGAEIARGEILVFVDADVCAHVGTLRDFVGALDRDPGLAAVFGAYDDTPPERGLVSQFRNLLHHYVHLTNAGEAETFWAGCGAVRRADFMAAGMFDERRFERPQVEDIDLGYRLVDSGRRVALAPEIQGTHLKRWALWRMLVTDFRDRAVPWSLLLLERRGARRARSRGTPTAALNLGLREAAQTVAAAAGTLALAGAAIARSPLLLALALACIVLTVAGDIALVRWLAARRGIVFALGAIPLRIAFFLVSAGGAAWAVMVYLARRATTMSAPLTHAAR